MINFVYDIAILGGGINGTGIARDAAGRGLSVFLCEQNDLASGTSSASTKLIHGGLRYLEYYEFRLVREALREREVLLRAAPHIIWPLRFILPHHQGLRPSWLIRLGLFLYDHIGGRERLPGTSTINLGSDEAGTVLQGDFTKGFEYSDCWVMDSRLVVLNAMDAAAHGASINTQTICLGAKRHDGLWHVLVQNADGKKYTVQAKVLINATGPWLDTMLTSISHKKTSEHIRMVKGSHIIVSQLFAHKKAYIFQNRDGRIIFAIPYENDFTLIGTTDVDFQGKPDSATISEEETTYLCNAANEYFTTQITPKNVVHTFSGIRPLFDDGKNEAKAATRDYTLKIDDDSGKAPLLSIYGGKITTYRKLAESVLAKITPYLPHIGKKWTENAHLPGGDFLPENFDNEVLRLRQECRILTPKLARRLLRTYGSIAFKLCTPLQKTEDFGQHFGHELYEFEVRYLLQHEWAKTRDDILLRRTNLGLYFSKTEKSNLELWLNKEFE